MTADYRPTTQLFIPDLVFQRRDLSRFQKSVYMIGHAETVAHGACRFKPAEVQWLIGWTNKAQGFDHRNVNRALRALAALKFIERNKREWRVAEHLLQKTKEGKAIRGKGVMVGVWFNPAFTDAEASIITCVHSETGFRGRTCFLTDGEIAEQTGFTELAIKFGRIRLLKKRCLRKVDERQRPVGQRGIRTVPGYMLDVHGITMLGARRITQRHGSMMGYDKPFDLIVTTYNDRLGELRWAAKQGARVA